jgi:hypothetical protein
VNKQLIGFKEVEHTSKAEVFEEQRKERFASNLKIAGIISNIIVIGIIALLGYIIAHFVIKFW